MADLTITLPDALAEKLEALAADLGVTVEDLARRLLTEVAERG